MLTAPTPVTTPGMYGQQRTLAALQGKLETEAAKLEPGKFCGNQSGSPVGLRSDPRCAVLSSR